MIDIKVPTVGESISEVTLVNWVKKSGDYVKRDEVIAELESEKATFEVTAEQAGILTTKANEDDTLKIGDILATIDESAAQPEGEATETPAEAPKEEVKESTPEVSEAKAAGLGVIKMVVPSIGESISEVTLVQWLKKTGDLVKRDEPIAEVESEKATVEVTAEQAGKLETIAEEDATLKIGDLIAKIDTDVAVPTEASSTPAPAPTKTEAPKPAAQKANVDVKATPVASAIIADKKVDTSSNSWYWIKRQNIERRCIICFGKCR